MERTQNDGIQLTAEQVESVLRRHLDEAQQTADIDANEAESAGISRQGFLGIDLSGMRDKKKQLCDIRDEVNQALGWLQFIPFIRDKIASIVAMIKTADELVFEPICEVKRRAGVGGAAGAERVRKNFRG